MKKLLAILCFFSSLAFGQTATTFAPGQVLRSSDLNSAFALKMDYVIPGASGNCLQSNGTTWQSISCAGMTNWASPGSIGATTPNSGVFTGLMVGNQGGDTAGIDVNGVHYDSPFKVGGVGGSDLAQVLLHRNSTSYWPIIASALSNSNSDAHTNVINNQGLLSIVAAGWAGSDYKPFAGIDFYTSGTGSISNASSPGRIDFNVTPDGSTAFVNAMSIHQDSTSNFYGQIVSTVSTGTPPFVVASTTTVANLAAATAGSATTAGTATNANNINITDDNATATPIYLVLSPTATGFNAAKVASSSLKYTPSTGALNIGSIVASGDLYAHTSLKVPFSVYKHGGITGVVGIAATYTALTYADNGGKVQLSSTGLHGVTTTPAVGKAVYVTWAAGTGVNGLYNILSVDSNKLLTIDYTYAVGLGTPSVTLVNNPILVDTYTVPANSMGTNGLLAIDMQNSQVGDGANNVVFTVTFGGATMYSSAHNDVTGSTQARIMIGNSNATNSQIAGGDGNGGYGFTTSAPYTAAVDTTSNVTVNHYIQLNGANETGSINHILANVHSS